MSCNGIILDTIGNFVYKHLNSNNANMSHESLENVKKKNTKRDLCSRTIVSY